MKQKTVERLLEINRLMYEKQAASFDATRQQQWPGWDTLLSHLGLENRQKQLKVLDVGCGNGRFGLFLARKFGRTISYTGIDQSGQLLQQAEKSLHDRLELQLVEADIFDNDLVSLVLGRQFDLVVCMGVMHHIPTAERRRELVVQMVSCGLLQGWLAISFWQLMHQPRFERKTIPLESVGIEAADVEVHDYVISFGPVQYPRYVHHFDDQEIDRLIEAVHGARVMADFVADGTTQDLNRYVVWKLSGE